MVLCIFMQLHRNNWSFDYFSLKFEHLLMKPLLCFYFLLLTFKWNWTKSFLVGRWIKIKLIEAKGACDSVWQSPCVAASSSQLSGWCNQKQSACYEKRLGVNVAHKGDYTSLLLSQKILLSWIALIISWPSEVKRKHGHTSTHQVWLTELRGGHIRSDLPNPRTTTH